MPTDHLAVLEEIRKDMRTDPRMYFDVIMRNLDRLEAAIALMRGQSWQPIETAPKDGSAVLIFHPEGGVCEGFCPGKGFGWHVMDGTNTYIGQKSGRSLPSLTTYMTPPTHWQPLPTPPAAKQERDDA